jgi:hypothetical protein
LVKVSIIGKGYWGSVIDKNINDMVECVEPKDADWIIISTPNDLHHEQVEYWLSQRKNVFCEKPLTLTKRSAEALFSLADFFGVKLYVDDVFSWRKEDEYVIEDTNKFTWMKPNQKDENYIDRLAYHHFYMWVGDEDIDVKSVTGDLNNFEIELEDGRVAEFSYGGSCREVIHTINEHDMTYSADSPLRTMFEFLFSNAGDYELNRKMTLNAIKLSEIVKQELYPKVLVVGGGIFGTTASVALATSGFNVTLHEELDSIMKCASDINQYRLHRGYHYPRSKSTAQECLDGLKSFKRKYGDSVVNGNVNHFYAISSRDSMVSKEEYLKFLDEMGLEYNINEPFSGTDLTVEVGEELFDSEKLRVQVTQKMKGAGVNVVLNKHTTEEDFDDYDYVVIATYAKINELLDEPIQYQYEVVEKPVVKLPEQYKNKSVVVMDGPFMCLDPYKDGYHVLGHVEHAIHSTNVGNYPMVLNKHIVEYLNNGVIHNPHVTKINKFIEAGMEFFEDFDKLEHIGSMFTIRTVLPYRDEDDARPTIVNQVAHNVYTIFSGKIGTCVEAANKLVERLKVAA